MLPVSRGLYEVLRRACQRRVCNSTYYGGSGGASSGGQGEKGVLGII